MQLLIKRMEVYMTSEEIKDIQEDTLPSNPNTILSFTYSNVWICIAFEKYVNWCFENISLFKFLIKINKCIAQHGEFS